MILILDNYDSFTYNLYQAVAAIYPNVRVVRNDEMSLSDIHAMDLEGIIISPGPGRPEASGIAIDLVKTMAAHIPMLGVCLGHQIITVAFGGEVVLADKPVHGKDVFIFHQRSPLYAGMPLPFKAGRYHSLITKRAGLPSDLIVEAESESGMVMGVRHHHYPIYGVQFHPESILTPEGNTLLGNFVQICRSHE